MRVFVTGATGFIGSVVVRELMGAGHTVLGLARSDASAAALEAVGAKVHRGGLKDLDSLKRGAESSDGVIHTAFIHDFFTDSSVDFFAAFMAAIETDRLAVETLGLALAGSDRPLVITSGTACLAPNRLGTEDDAPDPSSPAAARGATEGIALAMASQGVRVSVIRLPPTVHGDGDRGFVPGLIQTARAKGVSGYVAEGANRWPAVHRLDAASLYRLALEKAPAGSRFHGVAEEGVPIRDVATAIGKCLNVPVVSIPVEGVAGHFGPTGFIIGVDNPTSSRLTHERLEWSPTQPGLIQDLEHGSYFDTPKS